jgi:hypothetical protein
MPAATLGITQAAPTGGIWTQLPNQLCSQLIFQKGDFDLATSGNPGNNFFHVDRSIGSFTMPVVNNANTLWIRSTEPITVIWYS